MKNNYFGKTLFLGFFLFLSFTFQTFGQGDCNDLTSPIELQIGLNAEPAGFFVRSGTQMGRIFRDGVPSNCPSKVYPGIFNAGTTYNWTAVRFWNDDTGSTCITVNFDPNSGAGPCATNGHALVFQEPGGGSTTPYDPTNQGVNFLGDVGASTTQPFSMTVEPGWFEVVFTNTAAVANCSVQFSFAANGGVIMCDMPGGPISDCTLDVPQDFGGEFGPPASITADIPIGDSGILGTNYTLDSVELDITHTWDEDVDIRLQSPAGTILDLSLDNGGSGDNYTGTVFQDGAPLITTGSPPFTGTFQAQGGTFASAYNGEDINGTWTLLVTDDVPAFDDGTLTNFCINFAPILGDPPIISCPMDITVDNDAGVCGAVVNFADAVAIDPDGDLDTVTQTMGPASGSTFPVGDTLIEFTATDMAGNSATCQFTITVNDTEAPNAVCQDITVQLDANGEYVLTPGEIDGGSTDNCNIASLEIGVGTGLEGLFAVYPWTGTGNVARYDYDPVTDAITLVDNPYGSTTLNTNYAMDIDPTSGIVYLLGDSPTTFNRALFTYDLDTASIISEIGDVVSSTGATNPNSMAFGNDGTLYVSFGNGTINTIDPGTLAPAAFATVPNSGGNGMTFDSDNNRIIYSNSFGVIDIYEVTTAGATNFLFSFATVDGGCGGTAQAMEYVGNDKVVASTTFGCSTIYTIDVNTGTANAILSPDGFLNNIKALVYKEANITTVPDLLLDCSNVGTNNVTLVVTDDDGNQSTCEAVVTVEDNIAPVIVCNGEPATITDSVSDSPGVAIPDNTQPGVSVTIDITDDVTITDLDVDLNVSHTWVGDLDMVLTSPAGTSVVIFDRPGVPATTFGCSGDNIDATLDDEAATPVEDECGAGTPTINGTFIPNNPLSAFDGESTLGTWTLTVSDYAAGDTGTINSWGLTYSYEVASTPLQVILDANGMATLDASALLMSVDEACDYTVTVGGGGAPVPGSLATIFGSDNGGSPGGAIYFDLIVGPEDLGITDLDINTPDGGAFTLSVYTTAGSYVGNEGNAGAWTLMAT
ncbi:MAG TPA: proprotein convertase P-domain-containing protein, partial [Flavobacteriaceae bacterium]|nr:proprotein convertase P-domain-containing protein [Flavobacteriaceae bacterium]